MPNAGDDVRASDVIPDALTSYTPVWDAVTSSPAVGNGTLTGQYFRVGALVFVSISLLMGSSTTYGSGLWFFSLPVAPEVDQVIPGNLIDTSSGARYAATARISTAAATGDNMRIASDGNTGVNSTQPFTWASGDRLVLSGWYVAD